MAGQYGYIHQELDPKDWILGTITGIERDILRIDGQWDDYLPTKEIQRNSLFDTSGCVSFSALNCLETLIKRKYGVDVNFSDRFIAKVSGTTSEGNTMRKVGDSIRRYGLILEEDWGFPNQSTREKYYADIPIDLLFKGLSFLKDYRVQYETVFCYENLMIEALRNAPLQVAIWAYGDLVNGVFQKANKDISNHCVMLYGYEYGKYWKIYDHYTYSHKKLDWDYNFRLSYRYNIEKIMPEIMKLPNNALVQEVEKSGQFAMHLDGVLLVPRAGEEGKLSLTIIQRNKVWPERIPLNKAQWDSFPKRDLNNKPV